MADFKKCDLHVFTLLNSNWLTARIGESEEKKAGKRERTRRERKREGIYTFF